MLSVRNYSKAADFVLTRARPLDLALYNCLFESESKDSLLKELARFQNEDGGFGHGLEPDFQLPLSTPMATTEAFQYMNRVGVTLSEPMVQAGIEYFVSTYNEKMVGWVSTRPELNDHPHAWWWSFEEKERPSPDGADWPANPSAEIIGYLHQFHALVPNDLLNATSAQVLAFARNLEGEIGLHDFLCYNRVLPHFSADVKNELFDVLSGLLDASLETDKSKWSGYSFDPSWFLDSPRQAFSDQFREVIPSMLEWLVETQNEDGSWHPSWSWNDYPDDWELAKLEWQGKLTVNRLEILKNFHYVEQD